MIQYHLEQKIFVKAIKNVKLDDSELLYAKQRIKYIEKNYGSYLDKENIKKR